MSACPSTNAADTLTSEGAPKPADIAPQNDAPQATSLQAGAPQAAAPQAGAGASGFSSADTALPLPRIFGRLLLLKLIARGGMGDVYLAATTGIEGAERACVVKTVRRDHIHDGSFLARFLDEARVQSQLNHPGVAQVLEASTDENGEPYTIVEYVEGRSLSDVRQRAIQLGARIGWAEALAVTIEMAMALAHVHERSGADGSPLGIVHRDLSPQNVMLGYAGEVKLIDFGTARGHNRRCHTVAGVVFAKPGYVAPEVARQQVGDGRIDLYALGIMLWEMCAGRRFLTGDAQKHLEEAAAGEVKVPLLADLVDAPVPLDEVIQKLTANEPDDRYASATLAASDMARVLATATAGKNGERSVRGRLNTLMRTLWPHEPARSRAEFARLLKEARGLRKEAQTPVSNRVMEIAASHMNDDASILSGTPYKLLGKIGEGASGEVWEGEHVELGRKLAIKVLASGHGQELDRFRREARAVARLSHPNLVQLYDFGKALDGRVFLAMELLYGSTLDKKLKDERGMDWREAVRLSIAVSHALEAAHGAALVHRDLKPANLFLTNDGGLKLLDFGVAMALADLASDAEEKRQKGFAIFGTPEYMSPEQVAGEAVDGRCDLYALGCVLYELVTGGTPFEGASSVVVMGKQLREIPETPTARAPLRGIPLDLEAVIMKLLAKRPEDRFASAAEMRAALEETLRTPIKRQAHVRKIARASVGAAMALSVVIGAGIAWHSSRVVPTPPMADATETTSAAALAKPASEAKAPMPPSTGDVTASTAPEPEAIAPAAAKSEIAPENAEKAKPVAHAAPVAPVAQAHAETREKNAGTEGSTTAHRTNDVAAEDHEEPHTPIRAPHHDADRVPLQEARAVAKAHVDDPHALKVWATAAYRAGALREARRAADIWALHDGTAEPRLFLANVLDAGGHRADAKAVLEEWLQLHPDSHEARRMHARLGTPIPTPETVSHKSLAHR